MRPAHQPHHSVCTVLPTPRPAGTASAPTPCLIFRARGPALLPRSTGERGPSPALSFHAWREHQQILQTRPESTALLAKAHHLSTGTATARRNAQWALRSTPRLPDPHLQLSRGFHCAQSTVLPPPRKGWAQPPLGPPCAGQPLNSWWHVPSLALDPPAPHYPDSPSTFMIWYVS